MDPISSNDPPTGVIAIRDRNVWLIYGATALLGLAYGLAISVLALYLDDAGYSEPDIGTMAAVFAAGIVLASLPAGWLVERFSAKTVLFGSFLAYAAVIAVTPWTVDNYILLAGARFLDGVFSAGIWVGSETALLSRSAKHQKGLVMSLYGIAIAMGYAGGPLISKFLVAAGPLHVSFAVAAGFAALGGLLLWFRLDADGHGGVDGAAGHGQLQGEAPWLVLLNKVRCSAMAAFCYGYLQSAMVLFVPLYLAREHAFADDDVVVVPGYYAAGMFLFAPIAGYLGDRFGQLLIMRRLAYVGVGVLVSFTLVDAYWLIVSMIGISGACFAPQLPLALALQGVIVEHDDYARANAIYNALYATGMLLGPPITGVVFAQLGPTAMMLHLAAFWVVFLAYAWWHRADDPFFGR